MNCRSQENVITFSCSYVECSQYSNSKMGSLCRRFKYCSTCLGSENRGCLWITTKSNYPCRAGVFDVDDDVQLTMDPNDCFPPSKMIEDASNVTASYFVVWVIIILFFCMMCAAVYYLHSTRNKKNSVNSDNSLEWIELLPIKSNEEC